MKKIIKGISLLLIFTGQVNLMNAQTTPRYRLPHYEKVLLANGLTLYLMEKHDVPVISMGAIVPAGAINDSD